MIIRYLFQQPIFFIVWLFAILYALAVHEFSHALGAKIMGDDTAEEQGRLTLNPLAHIDLVGFFMLLFAGFGWGRPVPFNVYNLRNQKWGPAVVALFGPLANFISLAAFIVTIKLLGIFTDFQSENMLIQFLFALVMINAVLMVFNLIPIPPLDGSKVLFAILPGHYNNLKIRLEAQGPYLLLGLIIFDRIMPFSVLSFLFSGILRLIYKLI